jgi:hypothetical protein
VLGISRAAGETRSWVAGSDPARVLGELGNGGWSWHSGAANQPAGLVGEPLDLFLLWELAGREHVGLQPRAMETVGDLGGGDRLDDVVNVNRPTPGV